MVGFLWLLAFRFLFGRTNILLLNTDHFAFFVNDDGVAILIYAFWSVIVNSNGVAIFVT